MSASSDKTVRMWNAWKMPKKPAKSMDSDNVIKPLIDIQKSDISNDHWQKSISEKSDSLKQYEADA